MNFEEASFQELQFLAKYKAQRAEQFNIVYIAIAQTLAELSYCQKRKVGALLVKDNNIISYGFNGAVSGMPNICEDDPGATALTKDVHAEVNAVLKAERNLVRGASIYITTYPCAYCTILMAQAGIKTVFYLEDHKIDGRVEAYGMELVKLTL